MIDFEITESTAIDISDKIVSAVSTAVDRFFRAQKDDPDKYTPEIEKQFAALMWQWLRIASELADLGYDTGQFLSKVESEDDNAGV